MSRQTEPNPPSIPEQIWAALKVWAHSRAQESSPVSDEEAVKAVKGICKHLTQSTDYLEEPAVQFYAREVLEFVQKERRP